MMCCWDSVNIRGIKGGVKVIHSDTDNPDSVGVNKKMAEGGFFRVGLEECPIPRGRSTSLVVCTKIRYLSLVTDKSAEGLCDRP